MNKLNFKQIAIFAHIATKQFSSEEYQGLVMEVYSVSNATITSVDIPSDLPIGSDFLEIMVEVCLGVLLALGMLGNLTLFKVANYLIRTKDEAGKSMTFFQILHILKLVI